MATLIRAVVGYFLLLIVVRVLKRRAGSQITLFEFVLIFLIGGVIILSTVGHDRSVTNCTCAVMIVGLMHRTMAWAKSKNPKIGAFIDGTPLILIRQGEWQNEVTKGMRIRPEDVMAAARGQGLTSLNDVDYAVLERNGAISIIKKS